MDQAYKQQYKIGQGVVDSSQQQQQQQNQHQQQSISMDPTPLRQNQHDQQQNDSNHDQHHMTHRSSIHTEHSTHRGFKSCLRKICYCSCFKNQCFCRTSNVRALWTMFFLNTLFASSQLIAGFISNSLSLMGDSGSMLVDSLSYLVNIYAESKKLSEGRAAARLEGYAALMSVALLLGVTGSVLADASQRLCCPSDDEDDVDGEVVFVFASLNMLIDILMCGSFFWRRRIHKKAVELANEEEEGIDNQTDANTTNSAIPVGNVSLPTTENAITQTLTNDEEAVAITEPVSTIQQFEDLNMNSAFIHIFADTMRTVTSLVSGAMVWLGGYDSVKTDAIGSIIVSSFIILAAVVVTVESVIRLRHAYRS